jgi:hypothetical protein
MALSTACLYSALTCLSTRWIPALVAHPNTKPRSHSGAPKIRTRLRAPRAENSTMCFCKCDCIVTVTVAVIDVVSSCPHVGGTPPPARVSINTSKYTLTIPPPLPIYRVNYGLNFGLQPASFPHPLGEPGGGRSMISFSAHSSASRANSIHRS